ncbi:MAG: putative phosphatase YcdX [candidate division BRC1 bacterium ADurb.BinA364]|nr:MAG: putative phosphatase YcdX [candidate division BRC1 bacterium ADurb.BinA364]
MLSIDLHTHTLDSRCGLHTLLEVLEIAREKGIRAIAITDHGPKAGNPPRGTFLKAERTPGEYKGLAVLKGIEANILSPDGAIDAPPAHWANYDVVLAGFHPCGWTDAGAERNTEALLRLLRSERRPDIVSHPDIRTFPLMMEEAAEAAAEAGVALELNTANLVLDKTDLDAARRMIRAGARHGTLFALNSDGHTWAEFGRDEPMRDFLREMGAPALDIINDWPLERALGHFRARKQARAASR